MNLPDLAPPIVEQSEEEYHSVTDYLQASNRRKNVGILLMAVAILALIASNIHLALAGRPAWVVAIAPDGQEYIVSTPKKALDLRDKIIYEQVGQDLREFSEAYFERSAVTAQKDYEKARWFLPDNMAAPYDQAALGPNGWVAGLMSHQIPESHARIDGIEMRTADLMKEPFSARAYITRTGPGGMQQKTVATLTFVVRPDATTGDKSHWSRIPLYNALGVFIVKPIEETPVYR